MNILIGEFSDINITNQITSLCEADDELISFHVFNCDYGLEVYNNNDIDIIIIDFSHAECRNLLDEVVKINPLQKTITISNEIECSDKNGCVDCLKNLNRKRLLNTFAIEDLHNLIKNFDSKRCSYFNSFTDIFDILEDIMKRFKACSYNKYTKTINIQNNNIGIKSFIGIINILNQHNIKYEIKDITLIQLRE